MTAVYERELSSFFHSILGYLYTAFFLLITGILFAIFNLRGGLSEFGYALGDTTWVLLIVIPMITMRTLSEEQRLKTDQLLLTAPVRVSSIVFGKYLAILTVFALPLTALLTCPLVLSLYGDVSLPLAYSCLIAYFFMGSSCIAMGIFISSLTENQIVAAVGSFALLILSYLSGNIAGMLGSTALTSLYCFAILAILVGVVVLIVTRSIYAGAATAAAGVILCAVIYLIDRPLFEGAFASFLGVFSLFQRYYDFVDGIFDLTHLVYYAGVTFLFLFLSVQSVEKRRWA